MPKSEDPTDCMSCSANIVSCALLDVHGLWSISVAVLP